MARVPATPVIKETRGLDYPRAGRLSGNGIMIAKQGLSFFEDTTYGQARAVPGPDVPALTRLPAESVENRLAPMASARHAEVSRHQRNWAAAFGSFGKGSSAVASHCSTGKPWTGSCANPEEKQAGRFISLEG